MTNENGFTLLEALFSMAIFSVAMLGVIGLQLNSFQADEETRRRDMAVQLLTEGAELVECSGYSSTDLYRPTGADQNMIQESAFSRFIGQVESGTVTDNWLSWGGGKANVFLRYNQDFQDLDTDGTQDNNEPEFKKILLVASWRSLKTGQTETFHRVMVKPENTLQ